MLHGGSLRSDDGTFAQWLTWGIISRRKWVRKGRVGRSFVAVDEASSFVQADEARMLRLRRRPFAVDEASLLRQPGRSRDASSTEIRQALRRGAGRFAFAGA